MELLTERPTFFTGQILKADDLQALQNYLDQKRRLLNRALHGYGVVCGLRVTPTDPPDRTRLVVEPGLALDAWGREIVIPEPEELDLSASLVEEGWRDSRLPEKVFVILEYEETKVGLVPTPHCVESEEAQQPSRIREGYQLRGRPRPVSEAKVVEDELLEEVVEILRKGGTGFEALHRLLVEFVSRPCSQVPENPALTLAAVHPGPGSITGEQIDNVSYRRIVLSSARVLEALWHFVRRGDPTT